jgi:hypothetical protein
MHLLQQGVFFIDLFIILGSFSVLGWLLSIHHLSVSILFAYSSFLLSWLSVGWKALSLITLLIFNCTTFSSGSV